MRNTWQSEFAHACKGIHVRQHCCKPPAHSFCNGQGHSQRAREPREGSLASREDVCLTHIETASIIFFKQHAPRVSRLRRAGADQHGDDAREARASNGWRGLHSMGSRAVHDLTRLQSSLGNGVGSTRSLAFRLFDWELLDLYNHLRPVQR